MNTSEFKCTRVKELEKENVNIKEYSYRSRFIFFFQTYM